jgi:hypothetical protein
VVALLADTVGLGQPLGEFGINIAGHPQLERMQHIPR